jgi:hypothetical protein
MQVPDCILKSPKTLICALGCLRLLIKGKVSLLCSIMHKSIHVGGSVCMYVCMYVLLEKAADLGRRLAKAFDTDS